MKPGFHYIWTMNSVRWAALRDRVDGSLVLPTDEGFDAARRRPYVAGHGDPVPAALVRCASPPDVASAIRFAREHDLPLAVRSGGHCSAGLSSTDGLLVDVSMMDSVEVDRDRVVVGAGVRLAGLVAALAAHGRALPTGTCPTVGVAGLTLGGGWGILGRRYGLTCDHLTQAEVVTADGDVLVVDEDREPDLFWALRGGGTVGLAVVTSMVFRTVPAPRMTSFRCRWPAADAAAVTNAWLAWAVDTPDRMCAELGVSADAVTLHGAMAATGAETAALVDRFRRELPPARTETVELSYLDTARHHADRLGEPDPAVHLYSTSEFFERNLPEDAVDALLERFAAGPAVREISFMPWGGAYGAVPAAATAFAHRRDQHRRVAPPYCR